MVSVGRINSRGKKWKTKRQTRKRSPIVGLQEGVQNSIADNKGKGVP
jgi:hypothetical protein